MMSWKVLQIENTRDLSIQNCIRIVWHGISSEYIDARLSKIEHDGEEKHKSETSNTKFRRQKRENWDRSSGYESQGIKWFWERKKELAISGKQKGSVGRGD